MSNELVILHVLYATNSKTSGVRTIVPKHLEYQSNLAKVALLNCNDSEIEEAKDKYDVFKLSKLNKGKIKELPAPFNKPDLVVFHAIYYTQYLRLYKECLRDRIPYVVIPHGSLTKKAQHQKMLKKVPANMLLFNRFVKKASCIQFLIEGEKEKSCNVKKYIIDGNGIKISNRKKIYNNTNVNRHGFNIIYIGRYDTKTKGLDLLIKAIKRIENFCRNKNITISLYGSDYKGRKRYIDKLVNKNKIEDIISINDAVFGEEKINKLLEADVFIQVSRTEGQPVGLMEAIDLGLPCIISRQTNFGTIVEKNKIGWVTETTPQCIANKIEQAYNDMDKHMKMSEREKKIAAECFDWNIVAMKTIQDYQKLVKECKEKNNKNGKN